MAVSKKPRKPKAVKPYNKTMEAKRIQLRISSKSNEPMSQAKIDEILLPMIVALEALAKGDLNHPNYVRLVSACGLCAHVFALITKTPDPEVAHKATQYAVEAVQAIDACAAIGVRAKERGGRFIATGQELVLIRQTINYLDEIAKEVTEGVFVTALLNTYRDRPEFF